MINTTTKMLAVITSFMYAPVALFGGYLMLKHVQATELMWFVWIISILIFIVAQILAEIIKMR